MFLQFCAEVMNNRILSARPERVFVLSTNEPIQPPSIGGNKGNWGTGGQLVRPIRAF
jgi:hypothetical protein